MATGKRYYWIKLKDSFMTSDAVDFLMGQKDGANYVVLYQMICLKTINTDGRLERRIGEVIIPYDEAKIQRDELLRNARLTSDKIIEDARIKATEEADRIVENARESINYEKLKAMHDLKNQIASLSIDIAEKLMKAELSDKQKADGIIHRELDEIHLN